ncbi:MAG: MOSC domain-containing protein [Sandaracinus sp.]|nr:MOSC domain-containing protein [Sandaracinus sp.]
MQTLAELLAGPPLVGRVTWIGVRPARGEAVRVLEEVRAVAARGLEGDRYAKDGKRQISIVQAEHLPVIEGLLASRPGPRVQVRPEILRRNLVVEGVNVKALQSLRFAIGEAVFEGAASCEPCSKMEEAFGPGGYHAMRGMGGIVARIVTSGLVRLGDEVRVLPKETPET